MARHVWTPEAEEKGMTAAVWAIPGTSLYIIDRIGECVLWCPEAIDYNDFNSDTDGLAYAIKAAQTYLDIFKQFTHSFHYTFVDMPHRRIPDEKILKHYYPFLTEGFKLIDLPEDEDEDDFEKYID